jgi:hypothetical protein
MSKEEVMSDQTARMLNNGRGANVHLVSADQSFTSLEVALSDVLADRVRAGEPIHVLGSLDEAQAKLHAATVNRLMVETGLPVTVIHTLN